jgi:hypothetical protein
MTPAEQGRSILSHSPQTIKPASKLFATDPTKENGEFLNFVIPRRYWMTFLPLATIFNFSYFITHRPLAYTTRRMVSGLTTATYHGLYGLALYRRFGLVFALSALAFFPHVGFYFDRLREYSEHNLMPWTTRMARAASGAS